MTTWLHTLLALSTGALLAFGAAQANPPTAPNRDAGLKPPAASQGPAADKSPRCLSQAVNECRSQCEVRKFEAANKAELSRKQSECKLDCVRGC